MRVKFNIDRIDYWNFNKYTMLNIPKIRRNFILNMISVPIIILICLLFFKKSYDMTITVVFILTVIGGIIGDLLLIGIVKLQVMKIPYNKDGLMGEHTIEIDEKGVRETTAVNDGFHLWEGIHSIKQDKEYIYIFLDSILAHIIPKKAFNSVNEANEFYNKSVEFWQYRKNR